MRTWMNDDCPSSRFWWFLVPRWFWWFLVPRVPEPGISSVRRWEFLQGVTFLFNAFPLHPLICMCVNKNIKYFWSHLRSIQSTKSDRFKLAQLSDSQWITQLSFLEGPTSVSFIASRKLFWNYFNPADFLHIICW